MSMIDIDEVRKHFLTELRDARDLTSLEALRVQYLGRKQGIITGALATLPTLSDAEKREFGPKLNALRQEIEAALTLAESAQTLERQHIDLTVSPQFRPIGHLHPITQAQAELEDIFRGLGFAIDYGPEVETDWYNFTAMNMPEHHPARDMQDSFYVENVLSSKADDVFVLRTQTSPMQVRYMRSHTPPLSLIVPGRVFRNEATDATHEHTFNQMEGLVVGETVTYAHMVWVLDHVLKQFFGAQAKIKLLPSYFPFVEPGAEVAVSHPKFRNGQWIELLGCGMVHQKVFEAAGYPVGKYQGFAFGFGLTRFAAMKFGIPDIRLFAENSLQFLKQF
jgi:phenylalanyl-tRNA synthetase alpha chain